MVKKSLMCAVIFVGNAQNSFRRRFSEFVKRQNILTSQPGMFVVHHVVVLFWPFTLTLHRCCRYSLGYGDGRRDYPRIEVLKKPD
jgi:hypothetical protein